MRENYLLPPPILPQAQNGVLDKSKLNGEKIKVNVSTSPPLNLSDGDSVTVVFTDDNNESVTSTKQLQGAIGPFIEFDFSPDMLPKKYKVGYTVDDVIGDNPIYSQQVNINVIDGTSITPPVKPPADKEPFIVMGARYADLAVANGLKAPQRLTAWDKEGNPLSVTWEYVGGTSSFCLPFPNTAPFFYDTAPWLPISVKDTNGNKLTINPINVFGNGGTLGFPDGAFNDPMETQYSSAFAVLLNDNTMVGWGGSFGNSYTQSGIKTITTNGPFYAGLTVNSTLWTNGNPAPIGSFDDIGAGGNSFFAISKDNAQIVAWGEINGTYPPLGNGKNIFVGNSFACTIYNSGSLQSWWGQSGMGWSLVPPSYVPCPRNLTSMPRGFAIIDESGNLFPWGDPDMFSDFNPPYQDFMQATGIGYREPPPSSSEIPLGDMAIRRDGTAYGWGGMIAVPDKPGGTGEAGYISHAVDISITNEKILTLEYNSPYSAIRYNGFNAILGNEFLGLTDAVQITCAATACAALRKDGSVVTWENTDFGQHFSISQPDMQNVRAIYGTGTAFLALTADNKVYTWGSSDGGGDSGEVQSLFDGKLTYYMD
ncbi:hypothetical protein [Xenorhabdus japonica]|uniref:Alpha-tubulin suppressor n=1 Tax=Xenorhabdus japonica TaxID=53341 RepID=A0A1I5DC37_9GAMM|nr:hypothetical protein [Xenorhabdus japonica]SFN96773.1 hypothetical protein SAMN05421579_1387 [Xenorhabdus japonica]